MVKERPILFSAPMVKAILAGTKTQTRRVIRKPELFSGIRECGRCCPYGKQGERLWVRETWRPVGTWDSYTTAELSKKFHEPRSALRDHIAYRATDDDGLEGWRPAIFMPRWASRITLKIADARVEKLGEISNADAEAEGVKCDYSSLSFRDHFAELWDRINGERAPWRSNPWVWVIQFARV